MNHTTTRWLPLVFGLSLLALACAGGQAMSLEEYMKRLEAISTEASERAEVLTEQLGEGETKASTEQEVFDANLDFWDGFLPLLSGRADDLSELNPPSQAQEFHNDFVEAISDMAAANSQLVDELEDAGTLAELEELRERFDDDTAEVLDRADDACRELQNLADENDIGVDLGCG